jgi:segregation and condensation protein A
MAPRSEVAEAKALAISALGVIAPPPIHVQSPNFEGTLATLFRCVREHKVDLLGVPLHPICEAYLLYLIQAKLEDLDEAAAALAALAYLIERKAWLLLPTPEPEPELEEAMELPAPYVHEFATAIEMLQVWHEERSRTFFRAPEAGPDPYELPFTLGNVGPEDLARALARALQRAKPDAIVSHTKPRRSLSEQMGIVLRALLSDWRSLDNLIPEDATRTDVVYWFLALLELIRLGQAAVKLEDGEARFAKGAAAGGAPLREEARAT